MGLVVVFNIIGGILLIVAILINVVDWRKLIEKRFINDPDKARVYVEAGEYVSPVNGRIQYSGTKGAMYEYSYGGLDLVVAVPVSYPYKFIRGRRMIRVRLGEMTARGWAETQDSKDGVVSVSALVRSHLIVELVKSMTDKGKIGWLKWALIIGGVAVVGYFLYTNMSGANETTGTSSILGMIGGI